MKYRVYNLKTKNYCGENFFVGQNGQIVGIIGNVPIFCGVPQHFTVEHFTGFIVKSGQKIFVGDILRLDCFKLDYEVIWKEDRFMLKALYEETNELPHYFPTQKELIDGWLIAGTIHDQKTV